MTVHRKMIAIAIAFVAFIPTGCNSAHGADAAASTPASSQAAAADTLSPAHNIAVCGKIRDGASLLNGGPQLAPGWTFDADAATINARLDRLTLVQDMLRPTLDSGGPAARAGDRWLDSLTTEAGHLRSKQLVAGDADAIAITWASVDAVCKRWRA